MITNANYIEIPIMLYMEMQSHLGMSESGPDNSTDPMGSEKIRAMKVLRFYVATGVDDSEFYLSIRECKQIVDWIVANPSGAFVNNTAALIPASILE